MEPDGRYHRLFACLLYRPFLVLGSGFAEALASACALNYDPFGTFLQIAFDVADDESVMAGTGRNLMHTIINP